MGVTFQRKRKQDTSNLHWEMETKGKRRKGKPGKTPMPKIKAMEAEAVPERGIPNFLSLTMGRISPLLEAQGDYL